MASQVAAMYAPFAVTEQHGISSTTRRSRAADHTGCTVLTRSIGLNSVLFVVAIFVVIGIDKLGQLLAVSAPHLDQLHLQAI